MTQAYFFDNSPCETLTPRGASVASIQTRRLCESALGPVSDTDPHVERGRGARAPWSNWELDVLRMDFRRLGVERIELLLNSRSRDAIKQKARELGLVDKRDVLCPKMVSALRDLRYVGRLGYGDLCRMTGASYGAVWHAVNGITWRHVA